MTSVDQRPQEPEASLLLSCGTRCGSECSLGSLASSASSDLSSQSPRCRICWAEADEERGGALLSPCKCTGSVRYIHRRCLEKWQRTLRVQGNFRKATKCDLCCARYRPSRNMPSPRWLVVAKDEGGFLKTLIFAFEAWQLVILGGGLVQGLRFGYVGMSKGAGGSWGHVRDLLLWTSTWVPELSVAAMVAPVLQGPLTLGALAVGALSVVEVVGSITVCGAVGTLYGFTAGSSTVLTWSMKNTIAGACWGLRRGLRGMRQLMLAMKGLLRDALPVLTVAVGAATALR